MSRRLLAVLALLGLSACATALPIRFYTLSPQAEPAPQRGSQVVALGSVTLPDYLDRPEIVTRTSPTQVQMGEIDRWAEPLEPMVQRVLGQELARLASVREVVVLPQQRDVRYDRLVEVEVMEFEADAAGKVMLDARWRVFGQDGERQLATRQTLIVENGAPPPDYAAIAAAMSRALDRLAQEIVGALESRSA